MKYAITSSRMGQRDWLEELLTEAGKHNMKVRLVWTPDDRYLPESLLEKHKDLYPKDGEGNPIMNRYYDLNSPVVRKMYRDLIDEIGHNYLPRHNNILGIHWHELDVAEAANPREFQKACICCYTWHGRR